MCLRYSNKVIISESTYLVMEKRPVMAKQPVRKFRDYVSVIGISILAVLVMTVLVHIAYSYGYRDGQMDVMRWLQGMSKQIAPPGSSL